MYNCLIRDNHQRSHKCSADYKIMHRAEIKAMQILSVLLFDSVGFFLFLRLNAQRKLYFTAEAAECRSPDSVNGMHV